MAFLGEDSWKAGLSAAQLSKITLLEKQRDGLKNELSKKCLNFDILNQSFEKEKRKVWLIEYHLDFRYSFFKNKICLFLRNVIRWQVGTYLIL